MLLVKVQLPQHELSASLAELGKSIRVNQLTDQGAVKALDRTRIQALDEDALSRALAIRRRECGGSSGSGIRPTDGGPSQTVFVVHGSADQIRQSLANLVAKPDVAVETAPAEFKTVFFRSLGTSSDSKWNRRIRWKPSVSRAAMFRRQQSKRNVEKDKGPGRPAESGEFAEAVKTTDRAGRCAKWCRLRGTDDGQQAIGHGRRTVTIQRGIQSRSGRSSGWSGRGSTGARAEGRGGKQDDHLHSLPATQGVTQHGF